MLLDVPEWGRYRLLGQTRDDAAGEAFDKVAKLLELGYPGGPVIERLAGTGVDRFGFPRPMIGKGLDFSFSGLKTAVLYAVRGTEDLEGDRADIAASFQAAVFDVLTSKVLAALDHTGYDKVVLGGGVACSRTLAASMKQAATNRGASVVVASPRLNADNAAMIARAGWFHLSRGRRSDMFLEASATMPWPGLESTTHSHPASRMT
jgi:N6-L-threonylcarbamoyladenine synthase